ncbi:glycosyltransferase family 9 protein [Ignavibacteria bacterium CHB1]|nr:MAG: lipopolysaccharide heptosyltransferase family protein [Chlorobiota bacterium]MBV6398220.1 hypothetical protein [Ignavibacteria bacterium]MCE7953476.1 lipopolysaccharide heptosyltransferase family protein [Chlorobi bacterium CHB7]MDL1887412.1 glycosyltransferase family 9 protein [Ignavibacteria bacterium CHB1]RIK48659.1 MAG: hypothetical protein DCC60_06345 [Ignavibacteriota bacterium]
MTSGEKYSATIYLNNLLAFFVYRFLRLFFRKQSTFSKNMVFINTGQIGDITISSLLLENNLPSTYNYHFIILKRFRQVFNDYSGKTQIIELDEKKYKFNPLYRTSFIKTIRNLKPAKCYNLTSARGISNDELALLSGAEETICFSNSWKNLKKLFSKKMDSYYERVLYPDEQNEYKRHINLLNREFGIPEEEIFVRNRFMFKSALRDQMNYITLAPFSSEPLRCWPLEKFANICEMLKGKCEVLILGSNEQYEICDQIFSGMEHVMNLCGKNNIPEAATLISKALLHLGNDSGLTHVALKMGTPVAAIIGGYYFGKFFPFENKEIKAKYFFKEMECFGCEWNCIYDRAYCVTDVGVDEVFRYIEAYLS